MLDQENRCGASRKKMSSYDARVHVSPCKPRSMMSLFLSANILEGSCCVSSELTQQDGWKTQDGRMAKKCRARLCIPDLTRHVFVILPFWVFQPSCCVSSLLSFKNSITSARTRSHEHRKYAIFLISLWPNSLGCFTDKGKFLVHSAKDICLIVLCCVFQRGNYT